MIIIGEIRQDMYEMGREEEANNGKMREREKRRQRAQKEERNT